MKRNIKFSFSPVQISPSSRIRPATSPRFDLTNKMKRLIVSKKRGNMKKTAFVLLVAVPFLVLAGCKSSTGPDADTIKGTWDATKAEYVSVANSSTKVDIIVQGSTVVLVFNSSTFSLTITDPGEAPWVANGTWSASIDTMTLTWTSGFSGESQFDFVLDGDELTLTGGHVPFEFTAGSPEEAILNLILVKQ
jgi:hypothetical protein